jgi:hypothetical protein
MKNIISLIKAGFAVNNPSNFKDNCFVGKIIREDIVYTPEKAQQFLDIYHPNKKI